MGGAFPKSRHQPALVKHRENVRFFNISHLPALKKQRNRSIASAALLCQKIEAPFSRKFTTLRIALSIAPLPIGKPIRAILS